MARVAPVQTPELRPNPQANQQAKSTDPFAMLLDTVSAKRVNTPEPRRKPESPEKAPRVSAAEKPERPQPKPEAKQAPEKSKENCAPSKEAAPKDENVSPDGETADNKTSQQSEGADTAVASTVQTEAPVVAVEIDFSLNLNTAPVEGDKAAEGVAEDIAAPSLDLSLDASAGAEVASQQQQNSQQTELPEAVPVAAVPVENADVVKDSETETPIVQAAAKVEASAGAKKNETVTLAAEAETEVTEEAAPKVADTAPKKEETVQAQKPVVSNHAQAREAAITEKGEQQAQVKPANAQETNVHAKEQASAKPLEQVPAQSNVENSAPRQQVTAPTIQVMPEPVRALAGSINPVNLRAANEGATNAVQADPGALGVEIASRAKDGAKRFDIRLDPPELGRVEVRLETGADGKTSTRLIVERPETLDLLQRDARNLERALQSAGLQTDDAGLQFSLQDQTQQGLADANSDRGYERRGDFLATAIEDAEQASPAMDRYAQAILARGGVDIRI